MCVCTVYYYLMNATTPVKSLLSAKDKRTMHPRAQVQKLVRIGKRALAKADWYRELRARCYTVLTEPDEAPYFDGGPTRHERALEDIAKYNVDIPVIDRKAAQAADEALVIATENGFAPFTPKGKW